MEILTGNNNAAATEFSFNIASLRTVKSPVKNMDITRYFTWVKLKNIPVGLPMDVNPRETKMSTAVAKKLMASVCSSDPNFDVYNRGMVLVAKEVRFDNTRSFLTVNLGNDTSKYGLLDGGHTYKAIQEMREYIPEDVEKYVMLEILVGEDVDAALISDARNTSVQVSDIALFNLENCFDYIKAAIKDQTWSGRVAYKDNEEENSDTKNLHISDLLRLMFAFNIKKFPDGASFPISSYSGKAMVFKDFKSEYGTEDDIYKKLVKILPELVNLYESIQEKLPEFYDEYHGGKSRLGGVRGVEGKGSYKTDYNLVNIPYQISTGYLMPLFGAFRALLRFNANTGELEWKFDPIKFWKENGVLLVKTLFDYGTNPNSTGKDSKVWAALYTTLDSAADKLQNEALLKELERLRAQA
ncbi:hypothetical protein HMPREF0578_0013 [Mobiluncus mulieris 28-1]|uniref:AIPR family protein n=1 Tax=Mobiluncus mulieris TaxID=2052 RepID=UPI0001BE802B|nr:AIPR family protein [Mobiluncus mulieris]EEZ90109.1 hypothetical protein HMPREF0578_0013 [Mobiluncus mulieris 28-1]